MALTPKQQRFVDEYLIDLNATAAYKRAGYDAKGNAAEAAASRLLRNVKVFSAVEAGKNRRSKRTEITADRVLKELARLGFSDMRAVAHFGPDGVYPIDSTAIGDDDAACIKEVSQTISKSGGSISIKFYDKVQPLKLLGDHLGLFGDDRSSSAGTGPGSSPPSQFQAWKAKYLQHYFSVAPSQFHKWLSPELSTFHTKRGQRMNILAPRGAAKTTELMAYVLFCICEGIESFIILTSDTSDQVEKYLEAIKTELEENDALKADYPHVAGKGKVWRSDAIETRNGVRVEALSTGRKVRGRKHRQHRPTLIIVDDPQNLDHIISALQRSRSWTWLTNDVSNAGEPATNIIVAGTALHQDCIVFRLQTTPGWRSYKFQSIVKWPTRMDLWADWDRILHDWQDDKREETALAFYLKNRQVMDAGAEVLWPDREPLYALMVLRATIGEAAFAFEKQNDPTDPAACEWPPIVFAHAQFWFEDWPTDLVVKTLFLDPSKGASDKQGDYSAYIRYGRTRDGTEYVEADLKRRGVDQIVADGVEHVRQFGPDGFGVEGNTFQDLLAPLFRAEAAKLRVELPLFLVTNTTNKQVRIRRLTEPLTQRKIRFRRGSAGTQLLVDQLRQFPNAEHDDGPDSLEGARRLAIKLLNEKTKGKR